MGHDVNNLSDDPLLDQKQIIAYLGMSRTQFWRIRRTGDFPSPLQLTQGIRRWRRSQLVQWLHGKRSS